MNLGQGYNILAFEALSSPYAVFVVFLKSALTQMFDYGDEDILGVVFLKSEVRVGVMCDLRWLERAEHFRITALLDYLLLFFYLFRS